MSIASEIARISNAKSAIKQAINAKGGTLVNEKLSAYASAIDNLLPEEFGNRVRFIDWDGTVLKTVYVASGGSASPPVNPSHTGMTFQGWNTALNNVQSNRDIGAVYTTASGACELDVRMLVKTGYTVTFYPYIESGTLTIDWGNGSTDTVTGTGKRTVSYTYADYGDYTIKMKISTGGRWYIPDYFCNGSSGGSYLISARITDAYKLYNSAFAYQKALRLCSLSETVESLGESVFQDCRALRTVILPDSITVIGRNCFNNCGALAHVVFPDSVSAIPENCCTYCQTLDSVTFPEGVLSIGNSAFNYCYALRDISFPNSLTSIGNSVFSDCRALGKIKFPAALTSIGTSAFQSCYGLEKVALPNSITTLGNQVFAYCSSLKQLTLPANILYIPNGLCTQAYSLESIMLPNGITYIGDDAFNGCWRLRNVDIPESVTLLKSGCFWSCRSVENYYFHTETPPGLSNSGVFSDITASCRIYVPESTDRTVLTAYKTATNWSYYADYIYEEE